MRAPRRAARSIGSPTASAVLYYDTKAEYVWALVFDGQDALRRDRAARARSTGSSPPASGSASHVTPDAHVRDALRRRRRAASGPAPRAPGLVLRLDKAGHPTTLFDSGKPEVTAIVGDKSGRVWAAAGTAEMSSSYAEPAAVPQSAPSPKTPHSGSPADDDDKNKPEVSVSVSAPRLAPPRGGAKSGYSSEIVLFEEGEPARVAGRAPMRSSSTWPKTRTAPGSWRRRARAGSSTRSPRIPPRSFGPSTRSRSPSSPGDDVGTNASSAVYRRRPGEMSGEYVSAVKDTGRTSRFGTFRWDGEAPGSSKVEFAFRSGESAAPDYDVERVEPLGERREVVAHRGARRTLPAVEAAHDGRDGERRRSSAGPRRPTATRMPRP